MKKRFLCAGLVALLGLGAIGLGACAETTTGEEGYSLQITNKAEIEEEFSIYDSSRTLEVEITKDGEAQNPSSAVATGELTASSSNTDVVLAGGLVLTAVSEGEATVTVSYHGWKDTVNVTVVTEPYYEHDWETGNAYYLGFDVGDGDYYYANGEMQSGYTYRGAITKSSYEAVKVTITEGDELNGYYLSFEKDGVVYYIVIQESGGYMDLLYVQESQKSMLYWNEPVGAFFDESRNYFLCYNSSYKCLYGSSYSQYPNSPVATLYPDAEIEQLFIDVPSTVIQGESITLSAYALPVGASSDAIYTITSQTSKTDENDTRYFEDAETDIATISGNVLTGVNPGTITVTATSTENSNLTSSKEIEVLELGDKVTQYTGKLGLYQQTNKAYYYFTGEMSGNYGKLSTTYSDGVDVTLSKDNYYYYISFTVDETTKYVGNDPESSGHFKIHDDPFPLTYDETYKAYETRDGAYYLGNYSTYDTLSWSAVSYLGNSGQNIATIYQSEPTAA